MARPERYLTLLSGILILATAGCGSLYPPLIPVDSSPTRDLVNAARIKEDRDRPVLLRGIDGRLIKTWRMPNPFADYAYVAGPGQRRLLTATPPAMLAGYPIPVGNTRCCIITADLAAGQTYRIKEADDRKEALLVIDASGEIIARGVLIKEFFTGTSSCQWPTQPVRPPPEPGNQPPPAPARE